VEMISIGYSGYLKSLTCAYRSAVKTAGDGGRSDEVVDSVRFNWTR
jgi:hypothetical protein